MPAAIVHKEVALTLKDDEMEFVVSEESEDRAGDIVRVSGWELENFKKNPVVLYRHLGEQIGLAKVWTAGKQLLSRIKIFEAGTTELVDGVRRIIAQGGLRAASVGFRRTKPAIVRRDAAGNFLGEEFVGQELLEISLVPIPAHQAALRRKALDGLSPQVISALLDEGASARLMRDRRASRLAILKARAGAPTTKANQP